MSLNSSSYTNAWDTAENTRNNDPEIAKILALGTDREQTQQLLQDYGQSAYLFNASAATFRNGTGGTAVFLQAETWPALDYRNADIGAVVTILGPCGINQAHFHKPSELQFNVGPGRMQSFFLENNGLMIVNNTKDAGSLTLFPEGSMHMEMNIDCVPTTFISGFPLSDFARVDVAQFVNFGSDILNATFQGFGSESLGPLGMGAVDQGAVLRGTAECRQRCGLADDYDFATLYPDLGYFTPEWFNPDVFYSSLSIQNDSAPPTPSLTRRHLTDTAEVLGVASSGVAGGSSGLSHALRSHFSAVMAIPKSGSFTRIMSLGQYAGASASENPLQPVVLGLSFASLILFGALVVSLLGYGRRVKSSRSGEIKF